MKKFNEFIIEYKMSLQEKRRANRVPGASNEKPTGSVSRGTYKSSPEGQKRYKAAKVDIEVKQGLRDAGASGDFSPTMSPEARKKAQAIRDARMKRLATPDPFDDDYAKKTGKVDKRTKVGKKIGSAFEAPKKPTTKAPPGDFGPGDTKGQMNVKGMDRRAFKITKPEDIKKTAGYKPFAKLSKDIQSYKKLDASARYKINRDIQDYKDRDVPGGPRKTGRTSFKGQGSGSRFDPDIGMADDDSAKTKVVKQSEVSKNAQEFTKNINQQRQTTTPSKSDVNRRAQNRIDTQQADAFKKTAAYKNIAQGTDAQGNYLTPEQRKAKFYKQTKQNLETKEIKNKPITKRVDAGTSRTKKGNVVTQGMGRGSRKSVTMNKDAAQDLRNPSKVKTGGQIFNQNTIKGAKGPTSMGDVKLGSKSFKDIMPKIKKAATPAAKAFSKAGPVGKLAAAALGTGALIYGANQVRKAFAGAGKPKALPTVKGSALRYDTGPKKGQKKYFDLKSFKTNRTFTKSDLKDAGFGKPDRDQKLIKRLKSTK